jgi:hypothetical protein
MGKIKELFMEMDDTYQSLEEYYENEYSQYEYECMIEIQQYIDSLEQESEYFSSVEFLSSLEKEHEVHMEYTKYLNNENT